MRKAFIVSVLALVAALLSPSAAVAAPPDWNMTGTYEITFHCTAPPDCIGNYPHTMIVELVMLSTDPGKFSGSGSYDLDPSYTWTVTGTLSGSDLAFHILYTGTNAGYTIDALGTVAADGTLSGTATGPGQTFTWVSTDQAKPLVKYGDVTLSGGYEAGHFNDVWDLTLCDMTLSATVDLNGMVDDSGAHAWSELGIRAYGGGDFNPTWKSEGAGVWLATDYDWTVGTFDPDPATGPTLDMDDKLILQKGGGWGEGSYNLPSTPPAPGNNHRVWYDRDGVDPWQGAWPAVDGGTYNTNGIYHVAIALHATDSTSGTAYMRINGLDQGFETDGNWNTMELTPAGMTFTGDMAGMQVFYGLYGDGAVHGVEFSNIAVSGCLNEPPVVGDITVSPSVVPVNGSVSATAGFTDASPSDTHTAVWDWGDGTTSAGTVTESNGSGSVSDSHTYTAPGVYVVTLTVTDEYGQSGTRTYESVQVNYDWTGFFRPVDNPPTVNQAKAGSAIPVKFSLSGDQGLDIFAASFPSSARVACEAGAALDAIEQTVTAGGSSLSYDPLTGQYVYVWKTDKAWAGTCRHLTVQLIDGTTHVAYFKFMK